MAFSFAILWQQTVNYLEILFCVSRKSKWMKCSPNGATHFTTLQKWIQLTFDEKERERKISIISVVLYCFVRARISSMCKEDGNNFYEEYLYTATQHKCRDHNTWTFFLYYELQNDKKQNNNNRTLSFASIESLRK